MFIELIVAVFVGIIGKEYVSLNPSSYHSCSYGWAEQYNNRVFVKGEEKNGCGGMMMVVTKLHYLQSYRPHPLHVS